ncbi:MAG: type IV toxin-antitoxin system AbiEi family antitoxin domain-containing protein [Chloroflexota bacterium]|nr:type IV toxin-antitoxin system AbiEi family antitoxin domain-containing protein [Chloroflexota bacterium]
MVTTDAVQEAKRIFREHDGILRTSEALELGIHPRTLRAMRDSDALDRLARGLYRLADLPPLSNPDLVVVALKVPDGVICLVSALAFHDLTTEIPHSVDVALEKGSWRPRLRHPPLRVFWFSGPAWQEGVGTYQVDGVPVRITVPSKTVADMFKFRRQLGLDIALEALKAYRERDAFDVGELLHYARVCRVEEVMTPYLEALV